MKAAPLNAAAHTVPRWQRVVLLVAGVQCLIWGVFILAMPERSSAVYGMSSVPRELFLWQGTGLIILLFGIGYGIASTSPCQHWAVILIGLLAKILGPIGMAWTVFHGEVSARVLFLIPVNDVIWWIPFCIILSRCRPVQTSINP